MLKNIILKIIAEKNIKGSIKKNMQRAGKRKRLKVGTTKSTSTKYAKNLKINVKICKLKNNTLYLPR